METELLRDESALPTPGVIGNALGNSYVAYLELREKVTGEQHGLTDEWRYYNDGKAWLCKFTDKKKTIFWLSVWDGYLKISFYFTEKHRAMVEELEIGEEIKQHFRSVRPIGKLIPLIININSLSQVEDVLKIVSLKRKLK